MTRYFSNQTKKWMFVFKIYLYKRNACYSTFSEGCFRGPVCTACTSVRRYNHVSDCPAVYTYDYFSRFSGALEKMLMRGHACRVGACSCNERGRPCDDPHVFCWHQQKLPLYLHFVLCALCNSKPKLLFFLVTCYVRALNRSELLCQVRLTAYNEITYKMFSFVHFM